VRKQREILEDQADATAFRRQMHAVVRQDLPIGEDAPARLPLDPRDGAQDR
jgi:hypothetical protein